MLTISMTTPKPRKMTLPKKGAMRKATHILSPPFAKKEKHTKRVPITVTIFKKIIRPLKISTAFGKEFSFTFYCKESFT